MYKLQVTKSHKIKNASRLWLSAIVVQSAEKGIFHPITLLDNDITDIDLSFKTRRTIVAIINRELNAITNNWRYILNVTTQGTWLHKFIVFIFFHYIIINYIISVPVSSLFAFPVLCKNESSYAAYFEIQ